MKDAIILVGISGSGKTTWATSFLKDHQDYLRINRDDLRKVLVGDLQPAYYKRKDLQQLESLVTNLELKLKGMVLYKGTHSLIIDNTHLKKEYVEHWLQEDEAANWSVKFKLFDLGVEEAQRRVARREHQYTLESVGYIEKQMQQYASMKKWIETNHKDKIIT